jgi:plasmid stabilization system protein ParE
MDWTRNNPNYRVSELTVYLVDAAQRIRENPYSGQVSQDAPGLRKMRVDPTWYYMTYQMRKNNIHLLSVRHGARRPIGKKLTRLAMARNLSYMNFDLEEALRQ